MFAKPKVNTKAIRFYNESEECEECLIHLHSSQKWRYVIKENEDKVQLRYKNVSLYVPIDIFNEYWRIVD